MTKTVFFCWQSTNLGNKKFISDSLKLALIDFPEYKYDEATRERAGAVDVYESILDKIDKASLFVADISKVFEKIIPGKKLINSNVALEVGYALAKLPKDNIALIFDTNSGDSDKLPFDIRNLRRADLKFEQKKQDYLTEMFREMLKTHSSTPVVSINEPNVFCTLNSHSSNGSMQLTFTNQDKMPYVLNSIEIGGKEVFTNFSLVPEAANPFSVGEGLPQHPYPVKIKTLSFVISDNKRSYRMKQRINLGNRVDGQYNLENIDSRIVTVQQLNAWRKLELEPINAGFDGRAYKVTDYDTENSFELRISGSCWAILGSAYETDNDNISERFAYAINNKYEGLRRETVTIYAGDMKDDLNSTIESFS